MGMLKLDAKEITKKTDFAWVAGAGFKITEELGVNARYNIGISDFTDAEMGGKAHNNAIQLGIELEAFRKQIIKLAVTDLKMAEVNASAISFSIFIPGNGGRGTKQV